MTERQTKPILITALVLLAVWLVYALTAGLMPVLMVGGKLVSEREWNENLEIARKMDENADQETILAKLITRTKAGILSEELKLPWQEKIESELNFLKTANESNYDEFLLKYFSGNEQLFVEYVVKPSAIDASLRIHYNSKRQNNRAQTILSQALEGEDFDELARKESDDKVTAQFGGSMGFFRNHGILPELNDRIVNGPEGEIQSELLASRFGHHVVYAVETAESGGEKLWHGKHILIKSENYEKWFDEMTRDMKVRHRIK